MSCEMQDCTMDGSFADTLHSMQSMLCDAGPSYHLICPATSRMRCCMWHGACCIFCNRDLAGGWACRCMASWHRQQC